jgi:hypothetical protein
MWIVDLELPEGFKTALCTVDINIQVGMFVKVLFW